MRCAEPRGLAARHLGFRIACVALGCVLAGRGDGYETMEPWLTPSRPLHYAFPEISSQGAPYALAVERSVRWWNGLSDFSLVPTAVAVADPCDGDESISSAAFGVHECYGSLQPTVLGVTIILTRSINGGPYELIDADIMMNAGPGEEDYALMHPVWNGTSRQVQTGVPGVAASGIGWTTAVEGAIAKWNAVDAFPLVPLAQTGDPCADTNALSALAFGAQFCGDDFGEGVLAVAISITINDVRTDSDIVFNSDYEWDVYDGPLRAGTPDFGRVALHELGHVLALDHSRAPDAIMWPTISDVDTLGCSDRRGLLAAYGGDPDSACPAPPPSPPWHDWQVYFGPLRSNGEQDFRRVFAHELGHLLGLDHSPVAGALMDPFVSDQDRPACDDQAGVQSLYGPIAPCHDIAGDGILAADPLEISLFEDTVEDVNLDAYFEDAVSIAWSVAVQPGHGVAHADDGGETIYVPDTDFSGLDGFVIRAADGLGGSDERSVIVTVHPVNDAPVVSVRALPPLRPEACVITVPGWASFSPGPTGEQGQSLLGYTVSALDDPDGVLRTPPQVTQDGALVFDLVGRGGLVGFEITAQDSAGTIDPNARDRSDPLQVTLDASIGDVLFAGGFEREGACTRSVEPLPPDP